MTAIRIHVTAEDCAAAAAWPRPGQDAERFAEGWNNPVALAIARTAGLDSLNVDVDGDDEGWHVAVGVKGPGTTLVVDLPDEANERLDAYYAGDPPLMEPFVFEIEVADWLVAFLPPPDLVTLAEASRALRTISANGLRSAARHQRDGLASATALAGRLGMRRVGRDWLIPRDRLEAEVARRKALPS